MQAECAGSPGGTSQNSTAQPFPQQGQISHLDTDAGKMERSGRRRVRAPGAVFCCVWTSTGTHRAAGKPETGFDLVKNK